MQGYTAGVAVELSVNLHDALCPPGLASKRIAIACHDGRSFSYAALADASARLAHRLAGLGVRPGDRVAVQVGKSAEALLLYLACLRAGAVYLPLNTGYTRAELDYFLQDARPRLLVVAPESEAELEETARAAGALLLTLGEDGATGTLLDWLAKPAPDEAALLAALRGRLAAFKLPKRVLFTDALPRNAMGKVQKNLLREAHVRLYE